MWPTARLSACLNSVRVMETMIWPGRSGPHCDFLGERCRVGLLRLAANPAAHPTLWAHSRREAFASTLPHIMHPNPPFLKSVNTQLKWIKRREPQGYWIKGELRSVRQAATSHRRPQEPPVVVDAMALSLVDQDCATNRVS
jgi:hypothetical protein